MTRVALETDAVFVPFIRKRVTTSSRRLLPAVRAEGPSGGDGDAEAGVMEPREPAAGEIATFAAAPEGAGDGVSDELSVIQRIGDETGGSSAGEVRRILTEGRTEPGVLAEPYPVEAHGCCAG